MKKKIMIRNSVIQKMIIFRNYEFFNEQKQVIGTGKSPYGLWLKDIEISGQSYHFQYSIKSYYFSHQIDLLRILSLEITDIAGFFIGKISPQSDGKLFNRRYFYEIDFKNRHYLAYIVPKGSLGDKFCIYENEKQVALVTKSPESLNGKRKFELLSLDNEKRDLAFLFTMYYEAVSIRENLPIGKSVIENYTLNKDLLAKYDESWEMNGLLS